MNQGTQRVPRKYKGALGRGRMGRGIDLQGIMDYLGDLFVMIEVGGKGAGGKGMMGYVMFTKKEGKKKKKGGKSTMKWEGKTKMNIRRTQRHMKDRKRCKREE